MTKTAVATGDHPDGSEYVSTAEAARMLGVTPRTLYRWIDDGTLSAYRFGRIVRLRRAEVERFGDEWSP
jgi:excisionase family DNA binding protein